MHSVKSAWPLLKSVAWPYQRIKASCSISKFESSSATRPKERSKTRTVVNDLDKFSGDISNENNKLAPSVEDLNNFINDTFEKKSIILSKNDFREILHLLIKFKIPEVDIKTVLPQVPHLLSFSHSAWLETISMLKKYQFDCLHFLKLIGHCPALLEGSATKQLLNVLSFLRSVGFAEGRIQTIVLKHPDLLSRNSSDLSRNYKKLLEVFTKSDVNTVIMLNPIVLTDPWEKTLSKIEYIYEKMGIRTTEIIKCNLFKHSIEKIITRHEFLERSGLYVKPDKNGSTGMWQNEPLKNIMDSSDDAFAKIVAHLSLQEYETFVEIKKIEFENEKSDLTDDDDLSDSVED